MKFAISMPDDVFLALERAAEHMHLSRSELVSRATAAFLDEQHGREVTESYDRAFGGEGPRGDDLDRFRREATRRALLRVEW